jgi:hypothetical protein
LFIYLPYQHIFVNWLINIGGGARIRSIICPRRLQDV